MTNRRSFFRKLAAASVAVVVAPGVFRFIPAAKNLKAAVVRPSAAQQKAFVEAFFFSTQQIISKWNGKWEDLPVDFARIRMLTYRERDQGKWLKTVSAWP